MEKMLEKKDAALERAAVEAGQIEEALRRQNEYLTVLHETSLSLIDHLDKEELLELSRCGRRVQRLHPYNA